MISIQEVIETFLRSERVFLAMDNTVHGPDVFLFLAYRGDGYKAFRLDDSRHGDIYFVSADDLSHDDCEQYIDQHRATCLVIEPDSIEVIWHHQLSRVLGEGVQLSSGVYVSSIDGVDFNGRDGRKVCLRSGTYPNSMRVVTGKPCSPNV